MHRVVIIRWKFSSIDSTLALDGGFMPSHFTPEKGAHTASQTSSCCATAGRSWVTLPRVQISCPVISIYLKKPLAVKRFATDANVKQAVTSQLQTLNTYFFCTGIQALVSQWDECLMPVLTVWNSDVYRLLHTCHTYI